MIATAKQKSGGKAIKLTPEVERQRLEELRQRMQRVTPLPDEPNFATETETYVRTVRAADMNH